MLRSGSAIRRLCAERLVAPREPEQERVQRGPLLLVEAGEELVLDLARERPQPTQCAGALGCEPDEMAAPVARVAAALHQTALLELVEQADELSRVVAERLGDRPLRLARAFVEHRQHGVV